MCLFSPVCHKQQGISKNGNFKPKKLWSLISSCRLRKRQISSFATGHLLSSLQAQELLFTKLNWLASSVTTLGGNVFDSTFEWDFHLKMDDHFSRKRNICSTEISNSLRVQFMEISCMGWWECQRQSTDSVLHYFLIQSTCGAIFVRIIVSQAHIAIKLRFPNMESLSSVRPFSVLLLPITDAGMVFSTDSASSASHTQSHWNFVSPDKAIVSDR